nr:unnamed protein product [Callosobruchus chinensis]
MEDVQSSSRKAILLGDLNVKSPEWGSPITDDRGAYLMEWISALDLVVHNTGDEPTFVRGESTSFIDITCSTASAACDITEWRVLQEETMSDHQFIYFEVRDRAERKRYNEKRLVSIDVGKLRSKIKQLVDDIDGVELTVQKVTSLLKEAYSYSTPTKNSRPLNNTPYWWNDQIKAQREECSLARRKLVREGRRCHSEEDRMQLRERYKSCKRELARLIGQSKKKIWQEVCLELEADIWGAGYKIVTGYMNATPKLGLTEDTKVEIVDALFPVREECWIKQPAINDVEMFTEAEIFQAGESIKCRKAPGPDGIPPEVVKELITTAHSPLLRLLNSLLARQEFPREWKVAKIILFLKSGKSPGSPSAYRPICLLDTVGKLYELLLRERLEQELQNGEGFSESQYGFRKGRSTIQAVKAVIDIATQTSGKWCALVTLDVRNAFNSASWKLIISELRRRGVSEYIVNIISSYFEDRSLIISKRRKPVSAGVPQGSVLGPTLWNVLYDGVLRMRLPDDAKTIAFADDLALIVTAQDEDDLTRRANESLRRIDFWMRQHLLELAPDKTEAIILRGSRRRREQVTFQLRGQNIIPSKSLKYLGVTLDCEGTFGEHLKRVTRKAEVNAAMLSRLMPNFGGPSSNKRVLLHGVVQSIVLYGAPVWGKALQRKKYRMMVDRVQRKSLLRVASAYRTVSAAAVQVVTGTPPLSLLAEERRRVHIAGNGQIPSVRKAARQQTIREWQVIWEQNTETAQWTKRLIPDLDPWVSCPHRSTDYYLTQALTGHGPFRHYRKRFGRIQDEMCGHCGEVDTAEHTLFDCSRWENLRQEVSQELGERLTTENMVPKMICSERYWKKVHMFIKSVLKIRETEERRNN